MHKWIWLLSLLIILFSPIVSAEKAIILNIDGAISPATQDYIHRGIEYAKEKHAKLIILQLNTPGGLETSMRGITEAIINSPIPVVTYVAPAGSRAASAGTFIIYASHLAMMAPGTNIGAASPVSLVSPDKNQAKGKSTEEQKAINDASAYMRSLAQLRNRNASWGELAVRNAASLSAEEAKNTKVIDDIAENYPQLLKKIDGRTVTVSGAPVKISTSNIELETMKPDWRYEFLAFLTNPNIAYILMLIAIYGLFFELSNPGLVLPGVVGVISLLLVLYAFQLMPINYAGLTLILIGIVFMVMEVFIGSFGAIGIGGVIAFILGSIMLFDVQDPNYHITWTLIFTMSVLSVAFFFMVLHLAVRSHKKAVVTGREGLIGQEGIVLSMMNEQVIVRVLGEIWEARSSKLLNPGQKVKVTHVHGLTLVVEPMEKHHGSQNKKLGE